MGAERRGSGSKGWRYSRGSVECSDQFDSCENGTQAPSGSESVVGKWKEPHADRPTLRRQRRRSKMPRYLCHIGNATSLSLSTLAQSYLTFPAVLQLLTFLDFSLSPFSASPKPTRLSCGTQYMGEKVCCVFAACTAEMVLYPRPLFRDVQEVDAHLVRVGLPASPPQLQSRSRALDSGYVRVRARNPKGDGLRRARGRVGIGRRDRMCEVAARITIQVPPHAA